MPSSNGTGAPAHPQQSPEAPPQFSPPAQSSESTRLAWAVADTFYEDLAQYLRQARAIVDLMGSVDPQNTEGITFEMASSAARDLIDRAKKRAEEWLNASRGVKFSAAKADHE